MPTSSQSSTPERSPEADTSTCSGPRSPWVTHGANRHAASSSSTRVDRRRRGVELVRLQVPRGEIAQARPLGPHPLADRVGGRRPHAEELRRHHVQVVQEAPEPLGPQAVVADRVARVAGQRAIRHAHGLSRDELGHRHRRRDLGGELRQHLDLAEQPFPRVRRARELHDPLAIDAVRVARPPADDRFELVERELREQSGHEIAVRRDRARLRSAHDLTPAAPAARSRDRRARRRPR